MKMFSCLILIIAQLALATETCPKPSAPEGAIIGFKDFSLGKLQQIEGSMDTFWCSPILFKGKNVAWVSNLMISGDKFFGFMCSPDNKSGEESTAALASDLSELTFSNSGEVNSKKLILPGYGILANPSFCGSLMAYWKTDPTKDGYLLSGAIYDLSKKKMVLEKRIGNDSAATGNRWYYDSPIFNNNLKNVMFPPRSSKIKGITLQLP
jgi:hypothetical protein